MDSDYFCDSFDNWSVNDIVCQNKAYPKLNLFKNDSYQYSELDNKNTTNEVGIDFEQVSTLVINNQQKLVTKQKPINQKVKKNIKKERIEKDYKKNICRNILRHAIKSMNQDQECSEFIEELVDDSKTFKNFYNRQSEQITGFRVLRDHLLFNEQDSQFVKNRKIAFKHYLLWYLKNKASQMILMGETKNPQEYLRYKNEVLYYYIHQPHEWISNNPDWLFDKTMPLQFQSTATIHCI